MLANNSLCSIFLPNLVTKTLRLVRMAIQILASLYPSSPNYCGDKKMSVWLENLVVVLIWQFTWEVENCQNYSSTHRIWHTAAYSSEKKGH